MMSAPFHTGQLRSAGFFFGMRRSIDNAAYKPDHGYLFDPKLRILGQEQDLWDRMTLVRAPADESCACCCRANKLRAKVNYYLSLIVPHKASTLNWPTRRADCGFYA